jgi:hypothetical protein
MGAKATIAAIVPATTHTAAAQSLGRNPIMLHAQVQVQITDCINLLKQVVKDMTVGNASDPNIATLNTVITNLS